LTQFETGRESDDGDPYVCFRRREVRLARKTRARDNQSVQKLQKLKQELIDAMGLASLHKQNVMMQKEQMIMNRQLFEQRTAIKDIKRKLGIKGDDEDLINQKVTNIPPSLQDLKLTST
jgi:enhancer of polycomb-like protein